MADPTFPPDATGDAREGPNRGPTSSALPGPPRWVKVFGIIALALVVLVIIIIVTGIGGAHGPGRHVSPGGTPLSSADALAAQPGAR